MSQQFKLTEKLNSNIIVKQNGIIIFFILLFYCVSNACHSQSISTYSPKLSIPSSPEAALLGRFGDIPVGYYTGTADISVPLYSIKENDVEIPVTLSYHSSGIKVADEATWVGLGWDLSPEGTISVEIRGEVDVQKNQQFTCLNDLATNQFKNRFIYSENYYSLMQIGRSMASTSCSEWTNSGTYVDSYCVMNDVIAGKRQPDIFSYNFNGHSGKFYINPDTNQIVLLDNKSEDVTFEVSASAIVAKTIDGNTFYFNVLEDSHANNMFDISGYTYKLGQIVLSNNKTINFTYSDEKTINYFYTESIDLEGPLNSSIDKHFSFINCNKKTLTKIESPTTVIVFNLEDRDDIESANATKIKRLKSIDISSPLNSIKVKSYNFTYSYFGNNTVGFNNNSYGEINKRLRLDSLQEIGYKLDGTIDASKPQYKFDYKTDVTLPQKNSFAVDIWGYYNGQNNTSYIPNLDYFHYDLAPVFSTIQKPYFKFTNNTSNRYTNVSLAGAYMLNKITYPTGGYTEFEYEANSFINQFIPDVAKNNFAYKNYYVLDNNDLNNTVSKTFKLSREVSINFSNVISAANVNRIPWTYQEMESCYIEFSKIKMINGTPTITVIKRWDLSTVLNVDFTNSGGKQWDETLVVPYDPDTTVSYSVIVFMPNSLNYDTNFYHSSSVNSRFTYYDDINVDTSISNQCGMRVKSIKNYSVPGDLISHKQFNYYGGKLLNKFDPITMLRYNSKSGGGTTNGISFENIGFFKKISLASDDFGTSGGNPIGYDKVEELEIKDTIANNNGKKIIYFNNSENGSKTGLPYIPNLTNGLISKEEYYNKEGNKLSEKAYFYSAIKSGTYFYGIKPILKSFGSYVPCGDEYGTGGTITAYYNDAPLSGVQYQYDVYPLIAAWYMPSSTISKQYLGSSGILSSTETYTYNSQGKIKVETNSNSNGDQLSTKYYYANDSPNGLPIETGMVYNKLTGIPLVIENYKNTELLSRQNTQYAGDATTSNLILPKYVFKGKGSIAATTLEKKVTYDKYDTNGNLQQYTLENGTNVTILWGYNKTQPIAKIENASYSQIASALGITTSLLETYNESNIAAINNIRSLLPNTMVTTYTYLPLVGVKTITDPKGLTVYYEYDSFNRLQYLKDQDFNVLQKYCYNYLGQQTDCSGGVSTVTTYKNVFKSSPFTKQSCAAGSVGSTYVYSVPAGIYLSTISQADADTQADNEIESNGQNFVNANGTCIPLSVPPTGLALTSATATSVNFSWNAVSDATSYKIYKNNGYVGTVAAPITTGSLSGLTPSTTYNIQVSGANALGEGLLCNSVPMSTVPSAPTGLTFTSATASSLNFSWTGVTGATAYEIYKGGIYVSTVTAPTTTGFLSGLTASTAYGVQVSATNASGAGTLCSSISMSTLPSAPTGLAFSSATATSLNFSWTAVAGVTAYKIYKAGIYVSTVTAPTTAGSISGLTVSTAYGVQVSATNAAGEGALCSSISMSTLPTAPTGLAFSSATATSVNFSWTAVAGATGYKIYKNGTYVSTVTAPTTAGSLSGLAAGTTFNVQVLAYNASGDGVLCTSLSMSTLPSAPSGLTFTSATASSLSFLWTAVTGATGYKIYKDGVYISTVGTTIGSLSGLTAGTSYNVQVLAYNASGDGALCATVSMITLPAVPTGLVFTSATVSSLNFSWTAVAGATGYKIYKNGTYVSTVTAPTIAGSLSGLAVGTTYNVQVLAYNASGDGVLCTLVSMITLPVAPIGLALTSATETSLSFSWTAVTGATGYKIYKDGVYISTVGTTTGSLSGLTAGTTYNVQVLAYNASGDGALCTSVLMSTVPAAPTGLVFTGATASSLNFSWTPVTGATAYKIYKNGTYVSTVTTPTITGSLSGLTSSTAYNVQVLGTNTSGDGALCSSVLMSTVPAAPVGLAFTSASVSSLNFSWTAVAGATGYKIYKDGVYISTVGTTTGSLSGLTAGVTYGVQVLAYNASGDGVLCPSVPISTLPSTPTGLAFTGATATSVNFSWTAVAGATGYKIFINGVYNRTQPVTLCTLSGLTVATSYNVQVLAYNTSGDGALCTLVAMSTVLAAPTGLGFTVANASSINLFWTAVTGAIGYKIYNNGVYVSTVANASGSLTGLTVGTTYNIQVLAYNAWGDGVLSSSVPMSTGLAAPAGLTFTSATASVLNFSWTAVAGATGYKIYKNGVYISAVASTTGSLSGLAASTTYNVQVLAYDARGDGALPSAVAMTTTAPSMGFYKTSGTYPSTSATGLSGTVVNTLASSIYIYVVVQSASASSGSGSGNITINGTNISASGTFTNYGQSFVSTNYILMSPGSVAASGNYYGNAGSQMILAYSLYPGGTLTYWSNSN